MYVCEYERKLKVLQQYLLWTLTYSVHVVSVVIRYLRTDKHYLAITFSCYLVKETTRICLNGVTERCDNLFQIFLKLGTLGEILASQENK